MGGAYPYTPEWKSRVDKNSEDWRAYCEATALIKRFLRLEREEGRNAALLDYRRTLDRMAGDRHGGSSADRVDRDFRLIGLHEAAELRAQI